ncbi:hypothetical protein BC830DRAFT_1159561 [Chytriomyces sp. MP71]|nr:hypothetical protein BC830DRAFT_1159561 [Chytriomyces sp. MP71]
MQQNRERYEVAEEVWRAVELPQRDSVTQRIAEKKVYLGMLEAELAQVRERMKAVKAAMAAEASSLAAPTNRTAPTSERDPARQQPPHLPAAIPSDFMLPTSGSTQDHVNNTNIDLDAAINAYGASGGGSGGLGNGLWTIMEVLVILHTLPIVYWIWTLYRHRGVKDAEYVKKTDIKNLRELKRLAR